MKRVGDLYEEIISVENLELADMLARVNKKNKKEIRRHDLNKNPNILALHKSLKDKAFETSPYHTFKHFGRKERDISKLPYYPDRIVHHAIVNVCGIYWNKIYTKDTHSCIKDEGVHGAFRRVKKILKDRKGTKYCLKIDIRKYYPSVNHDVLKLIIRRKAKCENTLWLIDEIIDSHEGIPIGNYTSQHFANLYLAYFDHYIKEVLKVKYYDRYADDIVIFSDSKKYLWNVLEKIRLYFQDNLKLEVKDNYQVFPVAYNHKDKHGRGVDYVGYVFYHSEIRIRKHIKKNLCARVAVLNKKSMSTKEYMQEICGWLGYVKHTNSVYLLEKIIAEEHKQQIVEKLWKK